MISRKAKKMINTNLRQQWGLGKVGEVQWPHHPAKGVSSSRQAHGTGKKVLRC